MQSDPSSEDIPKLFQRLTVRDGEAFGEICRRYWGKLLAFAEYRVRRAPELCPTYDGEDGVGSGLNLMWMRLMQGVVAPPDGVDDFLRVARTMIDERIKARAREQRAAKRRPPGKMNSGADLRGQGFYAPDDLDLWPSGMNGPETEVVSKDLDQWLLSILGPELGEIAESRMSGKSIDQIARRRGKSPRTIERKLQEIRAIWNSALRDL